MKLGLYFFPTLLLTLNFRIRAREKKCPTPSSRRPAHPAEASVSVCGGCSISSIWYFPFSSAVHPLLRYISSAAPTTGRGRITGRETHRAAGGSPRATGVPSPRHAPPCHAAFRRAGVAWEAGPAFFGRVPSWSCRFGLRGPSSFAMSGHTIVFRVNSVKKKQKQKYYTC